MAAGRDHRAVRLPYWVTMSHPTYHFPVMAPLALLGRTAREAAYGKGTTWRGWEGAGGARAIQVEWVYYLAKG